MTESHLFQGPVYLIIKYESPACLFGLSFCIQDFQTLHYADNLYIRLEWFCIVGLKGWKPNLKCDGTKRNRRTNTLSYSYRFWFYWLLTNSKGLACTWSQVVETKLESVWESGRACNKLCRPFSLENQSWPAERYWEIKFSNHKSLVKELDWNSNQAAEI